MSVVQRVTQLQINFDRRRSTRKDQGGAPTQPQNVASQYAVHVVLHSVVCCNISSETGV